MSDIKPISARWDCKSEKTETYRLLNMVHAMAGSDATKPNPSWRLRATATYDDYVMTEWSNGIVRIKAETHKDNEGLPCFHVYTLLREVVENEQRKTN